MSESPNLPVEAIVSVTDTSTNTSTQKPVDLPPLHSQSKYSRAPTDFELSKFVAVILDAHKYHVSQEFIDYVAELALEHLRELVEDIKRFSEIQRRTHPSLNDTRYAFALKNVSYTDLYITELMSKQIRAREHKQLTKVSTEALNALANAKTPSYAPESEPFFTNQTYEITKLVPRHVKKPIYVPSYLPDLPPDYTFKSTAKYMDTLTDMEKLRVKLVQESRLTEKSLYHLIEEDTKEQSPEAETDSDSHMSLDQVSDIGSPSAQFEEQKPPELPEYALEDEELRQQQQQAPKPAEVLDKPFDVLSYVQKRMLLKRAKEQSIETRRQKRQSNVFMQAETYYTPYAVNDITAEKKQHFDLLVDQELQNALEAVKSARKRQTLRIKQLREDAREKEKVREANKETIEFGFNFNSDSDSDMEDMGDIVFGNEKNTPEVGTDSVPESLGSTEVPADVDTVAASIEPEEPSVDPEAASIEPVSAPKIKIKFSQPPAVAGENHSESVAGIAQNAPAATDSASAAAATANAPAATTSAPDATANAHAATTTAVTSADDIADIDLENAFEELSDISED